MKLYDLFLQHPRVQTDTRKLKKGDLYFALKGPNFNGNEFALEAIDAGASYAIVDNENLSGNERCFVVPDVLIALQELALHHRRQFSIPVLAITGSNGKTTTKELINAAISRKYNTIATIGNLNNHIGVPLTLLRISKDTEFAIIEMGANHIGEIASYCTITEPTHGLITNCGKAHLEGFGSLEGVRVGKGELYNYLKHNKGTLFRYADLSYLEEMAAGYDQQITYGSKSGADYLGVVKPSNTFLKLEATLGLLKEEISTHLVGNFNFPNVMAAVAVASHFGLALNQIKAALEDYSPDNSRSQWMQMGNNNLILDAYNANPTSMQAAIENFASSDLPNKQLWIGAMKEMGNSEHAEHKILLELIEKTNWQEVVLVGKEFEGLSGKFNYFPTAQEAKSYISENKPAHAHILIKGSRGSKMELLLEAL